MQIDDRLATVLRQRAGGETAERIQYRQLLDLLGTAPSEERSERLDAAYLRLEELSASLPAAVRARMLAEPGPRLRNPRLVAQLCAGAPAVAAAAIAAARLGDEQWLDLVPALPVASRAALRQRRDLGPRVVQLLARLGILDRGLPPAEAVTMAADEPAEAAPTGQSRPAGDQGIGAIVRRIENFRKARKPIEGDAFRVDSPRLPLGDSADEQAAVAVRAFDFTTDAQGRIDWADPGVAPMVAGFRLASPEGPQPAGLAAALRHRLPIRAARIAMAGAPAIAGSWLADAAPRFDPLTGGFTGYRGRMRRLDAMASASAAQEGESEADRIRQVLHELRTPVNAIQGFAEVIQQQMFGPAPHEYRALAAAIAADAARMLAGFAELERLARLEGGAQELDEGSCDLAAVLLATDAQLKPFTASRDSGFDMTIEPGPLRVGMTRTDAELLVWRLMATLAGAAHPGEVMRLTAARKDRGAIVRLQLPTSLATCEDDALKKATAGHSPQALNAGMFGTGFTLRLAKAEARGAGGWLERRGEDLHLCLPGLTGEPSNHSDTRAPGAEPG